MIGKGVWEGDVFEIERRDDGDGDGDCKCRNR